LKKQAQFRKLIWISFRIACTRGIASMRNWVSFVFALVLSVACLPRSAGATPIVWVDDSRGQIGKVDVTAGTSTVVGNSGIGAQDTLTDIAFDPLGNLFGIGFTGFYSINTTTGLAALIGNHGIAGGNALVFGTDGTAYAGGANTTNIYTINTATGAGTSLGNTGFAPSAGDLAFNGGNLYLAAATAGNDTLVRINLANLPLSAPVGSFGFDNVFGLATGDNGVLYGISGSQVFTVNTATGAGTALSNYGGSSALLDAFGSSFFTEAGASAVPEPASLFLLGSGIAAAAARRRALKQRSASASSR
ncbi:MAG TPA: PEP-CTERM sorting domain-containing protein, partial [Vicinamibacterales bacterium]|nr:PEP-CTERM sorting domain-containing protein [Vicinamibacterales bacterium]